MGFNTKDPKVRVDDTINYIVSQVPVGEQAAVRTYLDTWIANTFGSPKLQAYKDYSNSLSMSSVKNPGDQAERGRRRALMLLETMKAASNVASVAAIKNLAAAMVNTNLAGLIDKFRIEVDETNGTGVLIQNDFVVDLNGSPQVFLQNNRLLEGLISSGDHAFFYYEFAKDQYTITPAMPGKYPHCYRFNAVSVPAVPWCRVPGRGSDKTSGSLAQIAPTELTGASVMISTQFSGCAFFFKVVGGRIFAAHIMPQGTWLEDPTLPERSCPALSGTELAKQLAGLQPGVTGGDFAAPCPTGGTIFVYGAGYSNIPGLGAGYPVRAGNEYMNMFGTLKTGGWEIYSQHVGDHTYSAQRIH